MTSALIIHFPPIPKTFSIDDESLSFHHRKKKLSRIYKNLLISVEKEITLVSKQSKMYVIICILNLSGEEKILQVLELCFLDLVSP